MTQMGYRVTLTACVRMYMQHNHKRPGAASGEGRRLRAPNKCHSAKEL